MIELIYLSIGGMVIIPKASVWTNEYIKGRDIDKALFVVDVDW